jgi:lipid II:glycine glycyltransferase (peptidoglycan interpeptide bridge formation enzyme)
MNQSPEFLQSDQWLTFQEATGKETFRFSCDDFQVNGIIHKLPLVGEYLYTPRWPVWSSQQLTINSQQRSEKLQELIEQAKEKKVGWIRIEPQTEGLLEEIKKAISYEIVKAPHDMQPRENFIIDITKTEEELLAAMKPKVRYNIRLAEKRGVRVFASRELKYQDAFFTLIEATAKRQRILPHLREYYEKFFKALPIEMCELWVAEYQGPASTREDGSSTRGGNILAANLVIFYGDTVTYLHGGTSDQDRDVMAPVFLQWAQIREAKKRGFSRYDFGGVKTDNNQQLTNNKNDWNGITRFKTGFSPQTVATVYLGSYDIILDTKKYKHYKHLRHLQGVLARMKKLLR